MTRVARKDYGSSAIVKKNNEVLKRVNSQNSPFSVQATGHEHYQDKYIQVTSDTLDDLVQNQRVLQGNRKGYIRSLAKTGAVLDSAVISFPKGKDTPVLSTPVNEAFSDGAGTLAADTYYYRVSAIDANGETLASTETSHNLAGIGGVNVNWGAVTGATGYRIYGRTTGAEELLSEVGAVTTFLDDGSIAPSGALPTQNTTSDQYTEDLSKDEILNSGSLLFATVE